MMKEERVDIEIGTRKIRAIFTHSDSGNKTPVVIICHGYGSTKNRKKYKRLVNSLAERGIGSIRFDFFGHGESDGDFGDYIIENGMEDVDAVYNFIAASEFVDSSKIGIFGSSMGGTVAILIASQFNKFNNIKSMVLSAPAIDYNDIKGPWPVKKFHEDSKKYDLYKKAEWIKCPTLIIHGDKDDVVPIEQSEKFIQLLNPDVEKSLRVLENTTHDFTIEQGDEMVALATEWFATRLM